MRVSHKFQAATLPLTPEFRDTVLQHAQILDSAIIHDRDFDLD